jgi:glycosyltransferase involved in cell wall biosynthesis
MNISSHQSSSWFFRNRKISRNNTRSGKFRVIALIASRNEELYIHRVLKHLIEQGLEVVLIDNDSNDKTVAIAENFLGKGLIEVINLPYRGFFDHAGIIQLKLKILDKMDFDWVINYDADEIREAPAPFKTLAEAIREVDMQGYNAINFDEFVFLPTNESANFENTDFVDTMKYYYFFEPRNFHRLNAWKKQKVPVDLVSTGGHRVQFKGINVFPENFILRHYIALSKTHLIEKYTKERIYLADEVKKRGWHGGRATFTANKLVLPTIDNLKVVSGTYWDRSEPWTKHEFLGE